YKVTFFDAGIRYAPQMGWKAQPYLMTGFGVASVEAETVLSGNGTAVPPGSLGVQCGNDLNGTVTKTMFVIGGGAMYPLSTRYFVDGSFRYGRIFPKTSEIDGDTGINTLRAQVGFGISF